MGTVLLHNTLFTKSTPTWGEGAKYKSCSVERSARSVKPPLTIILLKYYRD